MNDTQVKTQQSSKTK